MEDSKFCTKAEQEEFYKNCEDGDLDKVESFMSKYDINNGNNGQIAQFLPLIVTNPSTIRYIVESGYMDNWSKLFSIHFALNEHHKEHTEQLLRYIFESIGNSKEDKMYKRSIVNKIIRNYLYKMFGINFDAKAFKYMCSKIDTKDLYKIGRAHV